MDELVTAVSIPDLDGAFRRAFAARAPTEVCLRDANERDRAGLFRLFCEVQAEARLWAGASDAADLEPLWALQFESQCASYAAAYPDARHYVVASSDGTSLFGRIILDWSRDPVLGIDLAVRSSVRRFGIGLHLMRAWLCTCDRFARSARLHVMPDNPARNLYRYLGFREDDVLAFPIPMLRTPRLRAARDAELP